MHLAGVVGQLLCRWLLYILQLSNSNGMMVVVMVVVVFEELLHPL
jgi:hypothetical protein